MSAMFTYTDEDSGLTFQWHGGEYIDVGYIAESDTGPFNDRGEPSYLKGELVATDCINVWDHAADEPDIPRTLDAFERHCREWLDPRYSADEQEVLDEWAEDIESYRGPDGVLGNDFDMIDRGF